MSRAESSGEGETPFRSEDDKLIGNMAKIKHKLMIISGKGGVGKSTVAVNLAYGLTLSGFKVGVLDVDIHGPSLAKMFGVEGSRPEITDENTIYPVEVFSSIKMMSMAFLSEHPDVPIIWRGPLKMTVIKQFLGDVQWGELDYLIIDSPPGTGDEPLSVAQLIPSIDGAIIVTTPQDVALLDSRKSVMFAKQLNVPVTGIIENMSGLKCPHCGKLIDLFKSGGGERASRDLNVPFLGKVPIEPLVVEATDSGRPFIHNYSKTETGKAFEDIVKNILDRF